MRPQSAAMSLRGVAAGTLLLGIVGQRRGQPFLDPGHGLPLAPGVVLDLVALDAAEAEIPGFRMREIEAGDRRGRPHREGLGRSEEHTSELQSIMRISYAVFCLKKKKNTKNKLSSLNYKHNIQ